MAKKKIQETPVEDVQANTLSETMRQFQEARDAVKLPICDICGGTLIHQHRKSGQAIVSTGRDTMGHKACWEALAEDEKQRRIDEYREGK